MVLPLEPIFCSKLLFINSKKWGGGAAALAARQHKHAIHPFGPIADPYCFTPSSSLLSAGDGGSARPPRYFARKFSAAALKAMLFSGRAKPWPSSGKT